MARRRGPRRPEERGGLRTIWWGGVIGLAGAIAGLLLPVLLLLVSIEAPQALALAGAPFWQSEGTLLLAGAILFLVSLYLYQSSFSSLKAVDRRFALPSALGWAGIVGFLALGIAAVLLTGSAGYLGQCVAGAPTRAESCLENGPSGALWGAYAGAVGLVGAWLGGLSVTLGLWTEGERRANAALRASSALYGILLLLLVGPILSVVAPFSEASVALLAAPFLLLVAPTMAIVGAGR